MKQGNHGRAGDEPGPVLRPRSLGGTIELVDDLHKLAELRSLALHQAVAVRLGQDASLMDSARRRVRERLEAGLTSPEYAHRWLRLLDGSLTELIEAMTEASESGSALRQTTPFSFVLSARDRWRMWREVRERWEKAG